MGNGRRARAGSQPGYRLDAGWLGAQKIQQEESRVFRREFVFGRAGATTNSHTHGQRDAEG